MHDSDSQVSEVVIVTSLNMKKPSSNFIKYGTHMFQKGKNNVFRNSLELMLSVCKKSFLELNKKYCNILNDGLSIVKNTKSP